jgi:superfamily II DNA or RNA helicase
VRESTVAQGLDLDRPFEVGERVRFRSLQWEVEDAGERLVTLFGREAVNRGRRVRVVQGLEPIERTAPPPLVCRIGEKGWDHADWQGLHDAFRLTLAHGRGSLGTAAWGRMVLEPYQLVPLQRIEQLPEPRLLIADDVGLGKTSEAGLILSRLLQRRRADRILVLSRARPEPGRWRDELQEKFGLEFEVIEDGVDYARLRRRVPAHLNLYAALPRLIVSMYFAAQAERVAELERPGLRWDVVVIDEAHHVADRGSGEKRLTHLGRVVAERCDALLLLTATPHDGKVRSFASLIELVDPYAVADREQLQPRLVRPLLVRRLKSHVVRADGQRFVPPEIRTIDVEPERLPAERHLERGIRAYARQLRMQQRALEREGRRGAAAGCGFLESLLRKRLASSVRACRLTLEQRLGDGEPPAETPEGEEDRPSVVGLERLQRLPDGRSEREVLEELIQRCRRIPDGEEAKLRVLGRLVEELVGRGEKVVVFTEYRDTLDAVVELLGRRGLVEGERLLTYHGETPDRDQVQGRFLGDPGVMVLVATDAASEGINLQAACNHLIHVEVPWNPNRYEQRNGRIDRYGQGRQPQIALLFAGGYVEQRAAQVVVEKLERIARELGSVSNVAPIAAAVDLESYLAERLGDEEVVDAEAVARELEERVDVAARAEAGEVPQELISGERFEAEELRQVEEELAAAAAFAPSFDDVRRFLARYLAQEGGGLEELAQEPGIYRVRVPPALAAAVGGEEIPRATFDRSRAVAEANRPRGERVAFLSPGHPLVAAALRRARGWLHLPGFASRVSYRLLPAGARPGACFTYAVRLVDGRGEAIEERFEVVEVAPEGTVSRDGEADRRRFLTRGEVGVPGPAEEAALRPPPERFERLRALAEEEVRRRAEARRRELEEQQRRVADEALIRLGAWRERREAQVEERFAPPSQLGLLPDAQERRRLTIYRQRLEDVRERERARRQEIERMRRLRVDAIEPIGALLLVPRGGWPDGT